MLIPWAIIGISTPLLITNDLAIAGDVNDTKKIVIPEAQVPGLNYAPVGISGFGNRHISFQIPVLDRNDFLGNAEVMSQFETLRNQSESVLDILADTQFLSGHKILFSHGVSSPIPLEYFVAQSDFVHKGSFINGIGNPQYSIVSLRFVLDEESIIYIVEKMSRQVLSAIASAKSARNSLL